MMQRREDATGVSAAVVVHQGRVLLIRRRVAEGSLSWQFPAGKIESGESPADAAVRETREEAGLIVEVVRFLGDRVHPATGRFLSYTACEVVAGTAHVAAPDEVAELVWCAHGELSEYVPHGLFEPVQTYLDRAMSR